MIKKTVALLLTAVTVLGATGLSACKKEETSTPVTSVVLDGFEEFEKDFLTLRTIHHFGKINLNTDGEYVKFGGGSAKLEPYGPTDTTARPTLVVQNSSARYGYDYTDYSKTEKISAWFYNAEEENVTVGIGLALGEVYSYNNRRDSLDRTSATTYTLVPGWNYVEYKIETEYLKLYDRFDITDVSAIFFEFEHTNELEAKAPVIYMDDLRLHFSTDAVKGSAITLKTDAEKGVWELADFDDDRQAYFWYSRFDGVRTDARMEVNVVQASKHNVYAKSGNKLLEIVRRSGQITTSSYPRLFFSSDIIKNVFAKIGDDIINNPQNYAIAFDFYNASPVAQSLAIRFGSEDADGDIQLFSVSANPYEWGSITMNIGDVDDAFVKDFAKEESERKLTVTGTTAASFSKSPADLVITAGTYSSEDDLRDRIYLIDNLRIIKIAEAQ